MKIVRYACAWATLAACGAAPQSTAPAPHETTQDDPNEVGTPPSSVPSTPVEPPRTGDTATLHTGGLTELPYPTETAETGLPGETGSLGETGGAWPDLDCTVSYTGHLGPFETVELPDKWGFPAGAGEHIGRLGASSSDVDLDLTLGIFVDFLDTGGGVWFKTVAEGKTKGSSDEHVRFVGAAEVYRWSVRNNSAEEGDFELCYVHP
jgi:hypothetical protein